MLRVQWSAIAVFIACIACGPAPTQEHTTLALETEDPRFQIFLEGPLPLTKDATRRELRLSLLPKIGWHMTPEAPTLLELSQASGIELDLPPDISSDEAVAINEAAARWDGIERIDSDGSVVYTESAAAAMAELGYRTEGVVFEDLTGQARRLNDLYKELATQEGNNA